MPRPPLSVEEYRDLIHSGDVKDPLMFLESIMAGQDPRQLSSIYTLVMDIDSFTNGELTKSDWNELVDHVQSRFKYHTVPLGESVSASKTLAEYLHAKRKQLEIKTDDTSGSIEKAPLSAEEIELFKEKFNEDF